MVNGDAALGQQLLNVPVGQAVPQIPADRHRDHLPRKPEASRTRCCAGTPAGYGTTQPTGPGSLRLPGSSRASAGPRSSRHVCDIAGLAPQARRQEIRQPVPIRASASASPAPAPSPLPVSPQPTSARGRSAETRPERPDQRIRASRLTSEIAQVTRQNPDRKQSSILGQSPATLCAMLPGAVGELR